MGLRHITYSGFADLFHRDLGGYYNNNKSPIHKKKTKAVILLIYVRRLHLSLFERAETDASKLDYGAKAAP